MTGANPMDQRDRVIIVNGRVISPWRMINPGTVIIEGNRIVEIREGPGSEEEGTTRVDAGDLIVAPGFIDIHVHGGAGHDTMDASPQAIVGMARFFARHGVTGFLPTTITAGRDQILAAIDNVAACQQEETGGARVLGVHVEGPYLSPEYPGVQPTQHIRPADPAEYERFFDHGSVRLITLAPEIAENQDLISYALERGAAVAVGHSAASYEEVLAAVALGVNQVTHTFNGMQGLHQRQPGTLGAALTCDDLFAQVIVDFVHVHPAMVKLLVRAKGIKRTVLITDTMRAAGLPDGEYELGGLPVTVRDGVARTTRGGILASSTATMDHALRNLMAATGLSLGEALPMATAVPAASIRMDHQIGSLEPGYDADLVILDDSANVQLTMVQGKVVYQARKLPISQIVG
jgi:N-acetylglucosamine-6-phosphate deacetylase